MAIQQIRRMRGGAQSHLMLASDNHLYVVKFRNNPQHVRVLANELLATRLGAAIGLSMPHSEVIEVTDWLIRNTPDLHMESRGGQQPCLAGLHFASRWVGGLMPGQVVDYLPEEQLLEVRNLGEFAGILALDKWTCNINGRQAVFQKSRRERRYQRYLYRPGILLSCRGLEVYRCQPGRGVCREHRLPRRHRLAELRTLAKPHREPGPGDGVGDCGDDSARMVWGRSERPGNAGGTIAGAPGAGARVDRGRSGNRRGGRFRMGRGGEGRGRSGRRESGCKIVGGLG